jgi:hypothetical protein
MPRAALCPQNRHVHIRQSSKAYRAQNFAECMNDRTHLVWRKHPVPGNGRANASAGCRDTGTPKTGLVRLRGYLAAYAFAVLSSSSQSPSMLSFCPARSLSEEAPRASILSPFFNGEEAWTGGSAGTSSVAAPAIPLSYDAWVQPGSGLSRVLKRHDVRLLHRKYGFYNVSRLKSRLLF